MVSELPPILEKIHARGFWRVLLRPTQYEETRLPTLTSCRELVEEARVRLRGWDYPHVDRKGMVNKQSWVESTTDWLYGHIEYWQLHQSGQFVHHFAMREDYEQSSKDLHGLDFINTLYTFTEIFEFAARVAARRLPGDGDEGALSLGTEVHVELHGCQERKLISWSGARDLSHDHVSSVPDIIFTRSLNQSTLLGQAAKIAREGTIHVLERFNWVQVPLDLLADEQAKLLERRL